MLLIVEKIDICDAHITRYVLYVISTSIYVMYLVVVTVNEVCLFLEFCVFVVCLALHNIYCVDSLFIVVML